MRAVQKGWLPGLVKFVSFFLPIIVLFKSLLFLIDYDGHDLMINVVFLVCILFFPVYFGVFLGSIFPTIQIKENGICVYYWLMFSTFIKWDEIESVIHYPNRYIVLKIDKKGFSLFNGTYFFSLLGKFLKSKLPVVIFSPWLEKGNEILEEVSKKSLPRIVQLKS